MQSCGKPESDSPEDIRSRKYAKRCELVARNIIKMAEYMRIHNLLSGAFWFPADTVYLAILALVLPATNESNSLEAQRVVAEMEVGRAVIASLRSKNSMAERMSRMLDVRINPSLRVFCRELILLL